MSGNVALSFQGERKTGLTQDQIIKCIRHDRLFQVGYVKDPPFSIGKNIALECIIAEEVKGLIVRCVFLWIPVLVPPEPFARQSRRQVLAILASTGTRHNRHII